MTDNEIIKALACCTNDTKCYDCPYDNVGDNPVDCMSALNVAVFGLINRQKAEIEKLNKFKSYFDNLYGKGLEVLKWHLNGNIEPFDNFYESALEERDKMSDYFKCMELSQCPDCDENCLSYGDCYSCDNAFEEYCDKCIYEYKREEFDNDSKN